MANPYYDERFQGAEHQLAIAEHVESEFRRVQAAFDQIPEPGRLTGETGVFFTTHGLVNSYVVEIPTVSDYAKGLNFLVCFHEINTGRSTLGINNLPAANILTLFGNEVKAGDLRGIRRLTYFEDAWRMQTISPSDLEDAADDAVNGIVQGPAGIPGASTVFGYDLLRTGLDVTGAGQYRFLMSRTSTAGVNSDIGLRLAAALELSNIDTGIETRTAFYDEVEAGDILTFFVAPTRWYAYSIGEVLTPRQPNTHFWAIAPLAHQSPDEAADLDTASEPVSFRWSRARAAIGGVPGVTGDQVLPELEISFHAVPMPPLDYTTDPINWLPHSNGFSFRNNGGSQKVLVASIRENGELLSTVQHAGYLYQWQRDGVLFTPGVPDPIMLPQQTQIATRRFLVIDARDVADGGANTFACTVCLA